uniref:UPAR/Ly6 domain-containing protein n=1 Tax=Chelonoidis abingdonii TaxID=106734 RepID=A0A8C0ITE0_CHEAB
VSTRTPGFCPILSSLPVAVGLECYSYKGAFTGSFSLDEVSKVTCGPAYLGCSVSTDFLGLSSGPNGFLPLLRAPTPTKGCLMSLGFCISPRPAVPPTLSRLGGWFLTPFPSPLTVPPDNTSSSLLCYTCIGITPESCSPRHAQQSQCHDDNPLCYEGTGTATIEDFVVPIYLRSCQAQGCASVTPGDPWLNIQLEKRSCCAQPLCNHAPEPAPTASPRPSRTAPTLDHPTNASPRPGLFLPTLLLGGLGLLWDQGRG